MELRQIQEYTVKPLLRGTPGVAEVNTSGGYERQLVIQPDPARARRGGPLARQPRGDRRAKHANAGGGYVEIGGEQLIVRAPTRVTTAEEIAQLPLKFGAGVQPILLSEVATVGIGSAFRTGASTHEGEEALVGAAIMLAGENTPPRRRSRRAKSWRRFRKSCRPASASGPSMTAATW